jgi:hypothetical protein
VVEIERMEVRLWVVVIVGRRWRGIVPGLSPGTGCIILLAFNRGGKGSGFEFGVGVNGGMRNRGLSNISPSAFVFAMSQQYTMHYIQKGDI